MISHTIRAALLASVALSGFAVRAAAQGGTISNGNYSVRIDRMGLIIGPPPDGLCATYGPRYELERGAIEWFGVSFDTVSGHVSAVGEGPARDYARRTPVQHVSANFTGKDGTTVARIGALEIEHTFSFCDATECLVIGVTLKNVGTTQIRNILYSREWRHDNLPGGTFPPEWAPGLPDAPADVWRQCWMPNNLLPGRTQGCAIALVPPGASSSTGLVDDVPLALWTNSNFPSGLNFGNTFGISFGDYDHDGWIDVVNADGEALWRNLDGTDWVKQVDLSQWMTKIFRYGCAMADYDDDQLLDICDEPRGSPGAYFLHALGGDVFEEVAADPLIVDVRPLAPAETNSVADIDGDGDLDWFFPVYPDWIGGPGNFFLRNNGPDANGTYSFTEMAVAAGLDNPPLPVNRPEGAEWVDVDYDGDCDLYSNNTIYRNISTLGAPLFEAMTEDGSGVIFSDTLDEGAGFLDYDMDGDMDLCIAFCDTTRGVRMFENLGDGTFEVQPKSLFDSFNTGLCLGLSHEDWDNDGDVDVTSSEVFRRNQFIETGTRHFTVATHSIPSNHITDATPAWGDFDLDGDLDTALGNWAEKGRLYHNVTYNAATPASEKRHVRIRVMRDSDRFDDGLESEFGAQVTLIPLDHPVDTFKRTKVVSTSGGYLNQNEYVLHFALPADPDPAADEDVHFRVVVDFKGIKAQGTVRIDRHVNPVLGDIDLAELEDREITIFRSGRVLIDGCDFVPAVPASPLVTVNGGLVLAGIDTPITAVTLAPMGNWFVGLEIDTTLATAPKRVEELIVDGRIAPPVDCSGTSANVFAWDVTNPAAPVLVAGGLRSYPARPRNDRNYYFTDLTLEPGRVYRIAARVLALRATDVSAPLVDDVFTTNGGLSFSDATPCTGAGIAAAVVDPTKLYMSVRFRDEPVGAFADLGHALSGAQGEPSLTLTGDMRPGNAVTADIDQAYPDAPFFFVIGLNATCLPLAEGILVPALDVVLSGLVTDASGHASLSDCVGADVEPGATFYLQAVILDPGATDGLAFTNAVAATTPR
jgi:hypothetical protein